MTIEIDGVKRVVLPEMLGVGSFAC